ncbi:ICMT-domain-containing protein, partial [Cubamyces sp. BRFM 1775]
LGAALALLGAALRVACFRALGPLFTFELTISPTHRLVTDGPYAWVRHPSYAGVYAVLLGASAVMVAPGAWLREAWLAPSLVLGTVLAWVFVAFWTTKVVYALRSTNRRLGTEDAELRRVFGAQWEDWAGRVPWRLVPWVF